METFSLLVESLDGVSLGVGVLPTFTRAKKSEVEVRSTRYYFGKVKEENTLRVNYNRYEICRMILNCVLHHQHSAFLDYPSTPRMGTEYSSEMSIKIIRLHCVTSQKTFTRNVHLKYSEIITYFYTLCCLLIVAVIHMGCIQFFPRRRFIRLQVTESLPVYLHIAEHADQIM